MQAGSHAVCGLPALSPTTSHYVGALHTPPDPLLPPCRPSCPAGYNLAMVEMKVSCIGSLVLAATVAL
jgi:hypothetical protein